VTTHTLLLVEPDPACAERLVGVLQAAGHTTQVAPTAAEARAFLACSEPHLIVVDLQVPDEDGLGLCASLREASDVPVVVTGTGPEHQCVVEALKSRRRRRPGRAVRA
jgi:DNA-binding response OmpR family regulator